MPRFLRSSLRIAHIVGLALWPCFAGSAGGQSPLDLTVERTELVLRLPEGQVLRGTELEGAIVTMGVEGGALTEILLASITPDPDDPDLLRHEFQVRKQGQWQPICTPTVNGETWGMPITLPPGHPGRESAITLTCASGAVGKCLRFGYKPWARGRHGEDLTPYHAACVHMVRADYTGEGEPHTRPGTMIRFSDDAVHGGDTPEGDDGFTFEAGWSPAGATCVARTRWQDLLTLDQLFAHSPRLARAGACTADAARSRGALLLQRSKAS